MAKTALLNNDNGKAEDDAPEAQQLVPFVRASRRRTELADETSYTNFGSSSRPSSPIDVPASGFLRALVLEVTASGGDGSTTAAVANEDAPFNILQDVQLADVNGNPIFGPVSGYIAYLVQKYGGHRFITDARQLPSFSDVDANGDFTFQVRIPVEVSARDAFGALSNMNAGQTYKLRYTVAAASTVYSTNPQDASGDALPDIEVGVWLETWAPPRESDPQGVPQEIRPPRHGATQKVSSAVYNIGSGEQTIRLSRVGNLIRTIIAVLEDSGGARTTSDFPDPVRLEYDGTLVENIGRAVMRDRMADVHNLVAGSVDAAGGLDTGVFVWTFADDLDGKAGFEQRNGYLPTSQATRLDLRGTFGSNADQLTIVTNDVAMPRGRA